MTEAVAVCPGRTPTGSFPPPDLVRARSGHRHRGRRRVPAEPGWRRGRPGQVAVSGGQAGRPRRGGPGDRPGGAAAADPDQVQGRRPGDRGAASRRGRRSRPGRSCCASTPPTTSRDVARMEAETAQYRRGARLRPAAAGPLGEGPGGRHRPRRRGGPGPPRGGHGPRPPQGGRGGAGDRPRSAALRRHRGALRRDHHPADHPAWRGGGAGRDRHRGGQGPPGAGRHLRAAGQDRPQPDRRGPGAARPEGRGHPGCPAGQDLHRGRSPGWRPAAAVSARGGAQGHAPDVFPVEAALDGQPGSVAPSSRA